MSVHTILLVEDHADTREMLVEVLSQAGLKTVESTNAETALAQVAALKPAVIVTDLRLGPGLDGLALCEQLKNDPITKDIPVLIVTGLAPDKQLKARAEAAGCIAVWLKPVDPFLLVAEVLKILDSQHTRE